MSGPKTRKMSDRHEEDLVALLGGERTRNSGAVWSDQSDGHQTGSEAHYRFAWDGKSTLGLSIGVTRAMWKKLEDQARGLLPMLPLRFYEDSRLTTVDVDLAAVDLDILATLIEDANRFRAIKEVGCCSGTHDTWGMENGECRACGLAAYEQGGAAPIDGLG